MSVIHCFYFCAAETALCLCFVQEAHPPTIFSPAIAHGSRKSAGKLFLKLCEFRHQFDTLRRAKFTTMLMLQYLHSVNDPKVMTYPCDEADGPTPVAFGGSYGAHGDGQRFVLSLYHRGRERFPWKHQKLAQEAADMAALAEEERAAAVAVAARGIAKGGSAGSGGVGDSSASGGDRGSRAAGGGAGGGTGGGGGAAGGAVATATATAAGTGAVVTTGGPGPSGGGSSAGTEEGSAARAANEVVFDTAHADVGRTINLLWPEDNMMYP